MNVLKNLPGSLPELYDVSDSVKIVEVAKKYDQEGLNVLVPEYTPPGGPNGYHLSNVNESWTQGFFPGLLWLILERQRLLPASVHSSYTSELITHYARRYQEGFTHMVRPAGNHDQGFRFQLSFGKDLELTGQGRQMVIDAADSLIDRYSPEVGCIRSWDSMRKVGQPDRWRKDNQDEHFLVIIDNMMNLDLLYEATELTGDPHYAAVATEQAEKSLIGHVRDDWTTFHVVDFNQDGTVKQRMTHQGYDDPSTWSRGQAWAIYGYAQCALRTGRKDFIEASAKLADKFLELLPESGVPWWDFDAPKPCPYDASAGTIAACGMLMLFRLLRESDPAQAEHFLSSAFKLIKDTLRECRTPNAILGETVDFGADGWETILNHSTINANRYALEPLADHGLVYADFYLVQFANEALKLNV